LLKALKQFHQAFHLAFIQSRNTLEKLFRLPAYLSAPENVQSKSLFSKKQKALVAYVFQIEKKMASDAAQ
jgi:hypothetical protein